MPQNWSFWERELYFDKIDYLIIGGGIVGTTTAIYLKQKFPESKIVILEKKFPGAGASTKNAGFACFGSASEILSDVKNNGEEQAIQLLKMRWQGLQLLREMVSDSEMSYEGKGSHELFFKEDNLLSEVEDRLPYVNQLLNHAIEKSDGFKMVTNRGFPALAAHAVYSKHEGQLNPMLMMRALHQKALNKGIQILYGIDVDQIENRSILTKERRNIEAQNIVVCNNGFATKLLEIDNLKMVRNQVLITTPIPNLKLTGTYHMDQGYLYFREYKGRLLIGGARNLDMKGETTGSFGINPGITEFLLKFVEQKILAKQSFEMDHRWSGILGVGTEKRPIVKKINPHLYVGIRLGGMGVAIGSYVGKQLASLID